MDPQTGGQPWDLTLLGTGSILNVYLDTRKSSEVNVLLGLLPANEQLPQKKLLITGEANLNLKNTLGGGETIGLNWQQIQVKSPRLNILFQQPYLFASPFGLNFHFDLLKKDSSFVNISLVVGAAYAVSAAQTGSIFLQRLSSNLLTVDTISVKTSKKLVPEDCRALKPSAIDSGLQRRCPAYGKIMSCFCLDTELIAPHFHSIIQRVEVKPGIRIILKPGNDIILPDIFCPC